MFKSSIIKVAKYNEWLSNIVPVRKKNGKIRVCVDYRDLNKATPKDVYLMPVADMLIDAVAGHEMLSFIDGTAGYHQIPVAEVDRHKTAFRCPAFIGAFDCKVPRNLSGSHVIKRLSTGSKEYLANPPVLVPPKPGIPLKLYISASKSSIAGLLAQDNTNQEGQTVELADHLLLEYNPFGCRNQPWTLYFDGSNTDKLSGAGISLVSPSGGRYSYSFQLEWRCTNNQAEYEAVIIGLEMLLDLDAQDVDILGDSLLVINQLRAKKENNDEWLVAMIDALDVDWRQPIMDYLSNSSTVTDKRICFLALNYVLKSGELLRRGENGVDFLCVYDTKAKRIMREVHLRLHGRGKWFPKWEGPFVIDQIYGKGAYRLRDIDGDIHRNPINGRYLKKYFPNVWEFDDPPPTNATGG
ncbi:hypothetical protein ACLB2K_051814 [Fragaria x ananassa]